METDTHTKRTEALAFLKGHTTGVLSTVSTDGSPRSRLVYYTTDDAFNVYFITLANTRKAEDLKANGKASFVIFDTDAPRTLQLEGSAVDLSETATNDPLLVQFVEMLMSHTKYGIPMERFDTAKMIFYKVTPEWIRWGDFTMGEGSDVVFTEVTPAT